jgi:hypothetical protein
LVIIAKKVQKAMQGQHPKLSLKGVPRVAGLPARNTYRNNDIAQKLICSGLAAPTRRRREGGKRQDVGRRVFSAVLPVQRAHTGVGHKGHGDLPPRAGWRRGGEPRAKSRRPPASLGASACGDDDVDDEGATF